VNANVDGSDFSADLTYQDEYGDEVEEGASMGERRKWTI
jgi:hypothetical protein